MAVNKQHPRYQEYHSRSEAIRQRFIAETDCIPPPPPHHGFDGAPEEYKAAEKKMRDSLKALQKEYDFLFSGGAES